MVSLYHERLKEDRICKTWYNRVMTVFDNLKNKLFKEENSGKGKDSQPAGKIEEFTK